MHTCIVCGSRKYTNYLVSLHRFPENKILREAWLRKIGEISNPHVKSSRICSLHFSEDCFVRPKRKKNARASGNVLKRLVPNAVPTLLLTPRYTNDERKINIIRREFKLHVTDQDINNTVPTLLLTPRYTNDEGNINIIRREFKLHVANPDINKDGVIINARTAYNASSTSGINKHLTIGQPDVDVINETSGDVRTDPLNVTASIVNIETPNASRSNPWLDAKYRSCHSPPRETNLLIADRCKSEPRTLGTTQQTGRKTRCKKKSKIQSRSRLRSERECRSVEPSPLYKRRESFFNENCLRNNQDNSQKDTNEDLRSQVQFMNELVQHYRSTSDFHMQSICSATSSRTSIEIENEALKLQLQQANAEMERLRAENTSLVKTLDDLHVAVEQPVERFPGEIPAKMQDLLKQYFTDGQIKSILEAKYRYFVYNL